MTQTAAVDKKMQGTVFRNEEVLVRAVYDFAKDGGAVSLIDLFEAADDCVLMGFHAYVKTTATPGGLATVAIGTNADDDGLVTATAVASLTAGALLAANGAITYPHKMAAGDKISAKIAVAALTSGKIESVCRYVNA